MTTKQENGGWAGAAVRLSLTVGLALLPLRVTQASEAQTFKVLYNFGGPGGSEPIAGVIADRAGNLYGATSQGGSNGFGAVFELALTGGETVLYSFAGGSDGAYPSAGLLLDAAGNLYGTAEAGGDFGSSCPISGGCGVIYKVSPQGKETVLYSFTGGSDGYEPTSNLLRDAAGNLYGVAPVGGLTTSCVQGGFSGCGVVFKLTRTGQEEVLYTFTGGSDGWGPTYGLIRDAAGNLYGTTAGGGDFTSCPFGCGVIYKLDTAGNESVLYTFTGGSDGWQPDSVLTRDAAGDLYGTTAIGGNFSCGSGFGCGVVFKLDSAGNETALYTFNGPDGRDPVGGLLRDTLGNLYGTASIGGAHNQGAVFKLNSSGKESVLHSFSGTDGALPIGGLLGYKGSLYGTTYEGGPDGGQNGLVFKIVP
jgi:uncharacterized repeat protein (TIGR03803 family)